MNNGTIITFFETARVRYLFAAGIHSLQASWNNLSFILAHIDCDFKKPIFYGQRVEVGSRVAEIKRSSLKMTHRVEVEGELAAEGYGKSVPINMKQKIRTEEGAQDFVFLGEEYRQDVVSSKCADSFRRSG